MPSTAHEHDTSLGADNDPEAKLIAKAMRDNTFREKLLCNPKEAVEKELDTTLPDGVTVKVVEDSNAVEETADVYHLVLPTKSDGPQEKEFEDPGAQLSGGVSGTKCTANTGCVCKTTPG